jgi:hypothetical protein
MKIDLCVPEFPWTDRHRHSKDNRNIFTPPLPKVKIKYSKTVTKLPTVFPYSAAVHKVGRLVLVFTFYIRG